MTGRAGRAALVALVLLTFGGATAAASPGSSPVGEVRQADVSIGEAERVLEAQLAESGVPGGAVALVSKGH
ncbi:MAG TPA: hypothetical protein DEQ43_06320, partial [Nocardioides bacterium]|nr:hypothetical protein [Nocardioides sp.]